MQKTTLIFFLTLLSHFASGQNISTKELENIAIRYGVDSVLKTVRPFYKIFEIDSLVALSIALKCSELNNYSRQFTYFTSVGQIIKNETINSKAIENLKSYKGFFSDTEYKSYRYFVIPDQVFHVLTFQNETSIIKTLKTEFNFWQRKADSIKNTYPSKTKRFFQRFKGTPPSEKLFSDCNENCYKLAWTLNKLGESEFSIKRANEIRQKLIPYLRDYNMEKLMFKSYPHKRDTIQLSKFYKSIEEINFNDEIELKKIIKNLEGDKCWKQLITNGKSGLYEIGCIFAPKAGSGKTIKLLIIDGNKLEVTDIDGWRS